MSWIKCSERMPDPDTLVWVNSDSQAGIGYIESDLSAWFAPDGIYYDNAEGWMTDGSVEPGDTPATHWQPLQPPPE